MGIVEDNSNKRWYNYEPIIIANSYTNLPWWWRWFSYEVMFNFCGSMDCSPPDSSVRGISQARILEWVAISSSTGSSWPRHQSHVSFNSCTGWRVLYHWATWDARLHGYRKVVSVVVVYPPDWLTGRCGSLPLPRITRVPDYIVLHIASPGKD